MKRGIKNYLAITKKEWNGLVIMIILIALAIVVPYVYQLLHKDNTINKKEFDKAIAQLTVNNGSEAQNHNNNANRQIAMFRFNPNNITTQQWQQLGLSEKQAAIIQHYLLKGGRFYNVNDLKRIYTLSDTDFKRLEPYVEIPKDNKNTIKSSGLKITEINSADSAGLSQVSGIWPALAKRMFRYKERLGGFVNKQQLKEVYGIDSMKLAEIEKKISVNPALVKKININSVSLIQFQLFPYLSYKQKSAVIEYRNQHGSFTSIADFKNITILDDAILHKIEPYLAFK